MQPSSTAREQTQFVVDLLTTLQKERFSPLGWWRFIVRSWDMSYVTAKNNPALCRSWLNTTLLMGILGVAILVITDWYEGFAVAVRLLPGFLFCLVWQQSDLFWHLGLNRQAQTGHLLQRVGWANTFTELRGLGATYLLGRLVAGIATPSELALAVFLLGVVTDILDGQVARHTQTQSKLGQISDGEADFCLYTALTVILLQNGLLSPWIAVVMVLRFFLPLLAALASYFVFAQPVRFGSTVLGKYAGLAQSLYFLVLLIPAQFTQITQFVRLPLLLVTLVLLVIAPLAQIAANRRVRDTL